MQRKKVLFLITKSNWGGAQRYVYDLATNLDAAEYEPVVALGGDGVLAQQLQHAGVQVIVINSLRRDISVTQEWKFYWELWQVLRREKPQVFHVNSSKAGGVGCFLGRLARSPRVVFTAHGWAFNEARPGWQKFIIKFFHWLTVFLSDQTIAVSDALRRQLRGPFLGKKWTVVHNGRATVDYVERGAARAQLHLPTDGLVTGTIGELHPTKQHDVMIRAVAALRDSGRAITHVIIGAGQSEKTLRALVAELDLTDQVVFAGAIHEAARYLQALDIYVQPSRSEALGYTVIEAAMAGLPIVASNVGGIPEVITNGQDGMLVASGDVDALVAALRDLLDHPDKRTTLGDAAGRTSQRFTFQNMLDQTSAVYESNTTSSASADSRATD